MKQKYGTVRVMDISAGGAWEMALEQAAGQTVYDMPIVPSRSARENNVVDLAAWKEAHECHLSEDWYDEGYKDTYVDEFLFDDDFVDPLEDDEEDLTDLFQRLGTQMPRYEDTPPDSETEGQAIETQEARPQAGPRWVQNLLQAGELAATGVVLAVGIALLFKVLLG